MSRASMMVMGAAAEGGGTPTERNVMRYVTVCEVASPWLHIYDFETGFPVEMTLPSDLSTIVTEYAHAYFSPDGYKMAYPFRDGGVGKIRIFEVGDGTFTKLYDINLGISPASVPQCLWSPDSRKLFFVVGEAGNAPTATYSGIYLVGGISASLIGNLPTRPSAPYIGTLTDGKRWSPDSSRFAIRGQNTGSSNWVCCYKVDDSSITYLTPDVAIPATELQSGLDFIDNDYLIFARNSGSYRIVVYDVRDTGNLNTMLNVTQTTVINTTSERVVYNTTSGKVVRHNGALCYPVTAGVLGAAQDPSFADMNVDVGMGNSPVSSLVVPLGYRSAFPTQTNFWLGWLRTHTNPPAIDGVGVSNSSFTRRPFTAWFDKTGKYILMMLTMSSGTGSNNKIIVLTDPLSPFSPPTATTRTITGGTTSTAEWYAHDQCWGYWGE